MGGAVGAGGQWGISGPAGIGRSTHNPAEIEQNAAEQKRPEAKRIQKRKSYVARTDLQRDDRIHQRKNDRHDPEKNHRCPVHRNQFVKGLGIQKGIHRLDQLDADQNGLQPADAKKDPTGPEVQNGNLLMIDGGNPVHDPGMPFDAVAMPQGLGRIQGLRCLSQGTYPLFKYAASALGNRLYSSV